MARRKYEFSEDDKVRVLLWCDRRCCLCGRAAGVGIEVAHIERDSSDIDNAIPLCFDCHAAVGHYNSRHPRGRKFKPAELKARREQVYEDATRHLVPPVHFELTQRLGTGYRRLPDVGFVIANLGGAYPVRATVSVRLAQGTHNWGFPRTAGHYDGSYLWNLNPGFRVSGHFSIETEVLSRVKEPLRARVDVSLVDIYDRKHPLLPVGYVHRLGDGDDWYFEPSEPEFSPAPTEK